MLVPIAYKKNEGSYKPTRAFATQTQKVGMRIYVYARVYGSTLQGTKIAWTGQIKGYSRIVAVYKVSMHK